MSHLFLRTLRRIGLNLGTKEYMLGWIETLKKTDNTTKSEFSDLTMKNLRDKETNRG